jgi:hypothetical protein
LEPGGQPSLLRKLPATTTGPRHRLFGEQARGLKPPTFRGIGTWHHVAHRPAIDPLAEVDHWQGQAVLSKVAAETVHGLGVWDFSPPREAFSNRKRRLSGERGHSQSLSCHEFGFSWPYITPAAVGRR